MQLDPLSRAIVPRICSIEGIRILHESSIQQWLDYNLGAEVENVLKFIIISFIKHLLVLAHSRLDHPENIKLFHGN